MKRCVTAAVALAVVMCAGCGTVANFSRPEDGGERPLGVYGGVTRSVENVEGLFSGEPIAAAVSLCLVPDVALSAIADTVTLPVTVPVSMIRAINKSFHDGMRDTYFPEEKPLPRGDDKLGQPEPERIHGGII
jgi:hypothetical protein